MKYSLLTLYSFCFLLACTSIPSKKQTTTKQYTQKAISNIKNSFPLIKSRVFVFEFTNPSEYKQTDLTETVYDIFYSKMLNLKNAIVFDSKSIPELNILTDIETNIINAENILLKNDIFTYVQGSIEEFSIEKEKTKKGLIREEKIAVSISINLKIKDIKNKTTIFDKTISAKDTYSNNKLFTSEETSDDYDEKFLKKLLSDMFEKVYPVISSSLSKLSWTGRIAKIDFSKVYINAGRKSGVKLKDLLKVVDSGDAINDPLSGKLIGIAPGRVKGTIEIESYFGEDGSIANIHTGGGFRVGDRVELY